jgi:hypothetical protein
LITQCPMTLTHTPRPTQSPSTSGFPPGRKQFPYVPPFTNGHNRNMAEGKNC